MLGRFLGALLFFFFNFSNVRYTVFTILCHNRYCFTGESAVCVQTPAYRQVFAATDSCQMVSYGAVCHGPQQLTDMIPNGPTIRLV